MLTLLILVLLFVVLFMAVAIVTGIVAIAPVFLVIGIFVLLDCLLIKIIFGKKKK